jgi:hypothetical protein
MVELTDEARRCLDLYLAEVRSSLRHCPSVNAADVERDVVEHIEHALAGASLAVDAPELRVVLRGLGSPSQWVPQEELSRIQRALLALRSGPEDLRLGYLAFGLLAGTLLAAACLNLAVGFAGMLPFLLLGIAASFLFARASLSAIGGADGAERWLIYPSLIVVYVPLSAVILLLPLIAAILTEMVLTDPGGDQKLAWAHTSTMGVITAFSLLTYGSLWWGFLCFVAWRFPAVVRDGFAPFAPGFRRLSGLLGASVLCLIIFLACATIWVASVRRHLREMETAPPASPPSSLPLPSSPERPPTPR